MDFRLADDRTTPPTSSSYCVVPGLLLAGAYPGDPDPDEHQARFHALLDAGVRTFFNLMEKDETDYAGEPFVPYQDPAGQLCPDVRCCRHAIRDLSGPTPVQMTEILDAIDAALATGSPVYVHCRGGVTGTFVGCRLLRHRYANVCASAPASIFADGKKLKRFSLFGGRLAAQAAVVGEYLSG